MNKNVNRSGVDGWLLAFILLLGIAAPIYYAVEFNMVFGHVRYQVRAGMLPPGAGYLVIILTALLALLAIGGPLWAAFRLWRDFRWASVRFAIGAVWLAFVGVPVLDTLSGIAFAPEVWFDLIVAKLPMFARHIVVAFGAMVYLTSSRRVANTYKRPGSLGEANHVFE